ncbi:bifunctional phosphoglucose/phosphomannose isomerase [Candidatus Formimonas warabiya]|uniref:Bifunctional phosphoglucose/phosphomannose isomerase n=1 Tax=Formimonas warabiya TaxID=1761012 RepID=A0A3G1KU01_FORW1|nr:bifunctional phosphoglucose/phosphomannose isomerase [Candidatus Formimonas warabiya]ATW25910.1 bifunctional phosphoglucose/phosphomannose isomerase [Candidatus Formimonas warabiya]
MQYQVNLDDREALKTIDGGQMLGALAGLPDQCRGAVALARNQEINYSRSFQNVVVTGLGGSAIGGDFLRVFCADKSPVPVTVNRDYHLPGYVNEHTLVFAVSYSGNTEETLSAYEEAKAKGAAVVAVTSGGKLADLAQKDGIPFLAIPGGLQPRAATGYLFLPLLIVMEKLHLISVLTDDLEDLGRALEDMGRRLAPEVEETNNPAKQLAKLFYQKIPVIWGVSGTTETVAMRWKGQINENSKAPAYFNVLPELNHNEIVGTEAPAELLKKIELVFLHSLDDHPRVEKRFEITKEIIGERVSGITEIWGEGNCLLSRMFTLTYLGDYTSVYLAILYGINPSPVELITLLKNKLAESS